MIQQLRAMKLWSQQKIQKIILAIENHILNRQFQHFTCFCINCNNNTDNH